MHDWKPGDEATVFDFGPEHVDHVVLPASVPPMHVYVIMKGSSEMDRDVFDVAWTLDQAMDLVEEERNRTEGPNHSTHAWVQGGRPHKGEGGRPYWQAVVDGNTSAGYGIFRWPVRGAR